MFDEQRLEVTLVEAGPRICRRCPNGSPTPRAPSSRRLGVRVLTDTPVTEVTADAIVTKSGERIVADLKLWAAGVRAPDLAGGPGGLEANRNGQFLVLPTLQTVTDPRVLAIGDCCACPIPGSDRPVPPRAQAAHQMATCAYRNLVRLMAGRPLHDFHYHDHGSLVSLSRFSTVGSLMGNLIGGRMAIEGRLARFVYASLYRMHLIAIHGWWRGLTLMAVGRVNAIVRPRLKLH
ncbi:MAG: FAD-dependent oxidoreductase [Sphingomonas sp.]